MELTRGGYRARIERDSVSQRGQRLTTFVVRFPRCILAEVNTHRMLSRSSASSRAIPVKTMIERVLDDPYVPEEFGRNERGMQSNATLDEEDQLLAREVWLSAREEAVRFARSLAGLEVHKQFANRLLEPFMWHEAVISGTDWSNFFHLRVHRMAHPAFRMIAEMMAELYLTEEPALVRYGEWHLPFIQPDEMERKDWFIPMSSRVCAAAQISAARVARVSYLTHEGKRDPIKDLELYSRLVDNKPPHSSPAEHVATPSPAEGYIGNFNGWKQLRKFLRNENQWHYGLEDLRRYQRDMREMGGEANVTQS